MFAEPITFKILSPNRQKPLDIYIMRAWTKFHHWIWSWEGGGNDRVVVVQDKYNLYSVQSTNSFLGIAPPLFIKLNNFSSRVCSPHPN